MACSAIIATPGSGNEAESIREGGGDIARVSAAVTEISTRVWLDEQLWDGLRNRAQAEQTTIRELIPDLLGRALSGEARQPAAPSSPPPLPKPAEPLASAPAPVVTPPAEAGPPVVALSDVYQCGVCGTQIRLGGLSNHLGRHLKEQQSAEGERS